MQSINRQNIAEHLFEYQLAMIDKVPADTEENNLWMLDWTLTEEQYSKLKGYAIPLIKKVFKCNRTKAENIFHWFNINFGLSIKN